MRAPRTPSQYCKSNRSELRTRLAETTDALTKVGMVPIGPRFLRLKGINERVVRGDWALGHAGNTIHEIISMLVEAMPVLVNSQK
jgi:hypothetical protein